MICLRELVACGKVSSLKNLMPSIKNIYSRRKVSIVCRIYVGHDGIIQISNDSAPVSVVIRKNGTTAKKCAKKLDAKICSWILSFFDGSAKTTLFVFPQFPGQREIA